MAFVGNFTSFIRLHTHRLYTSFDGFNVCGAGFVLLLMKNLFFKKLSQSSFHWERSFSSHPIMIHYSSEMASAETIFLYGECDYPIFLLYGEIFFPFFLQHGESAPTIIFLLCGVIRSPFSSPLEQALTSSASVDLSSASPPSLLSMVCAPLTATLERTLPPPSPLWRSFLNAQRL